jgi:hypothetical protein
MFIEPPNYYTNDIIVDFNFSSSNDHLCALTLKGTTKIIKYDSNEVTELETIESKIEDFG